MNVKGEGSCKLLVSRARVGGAPLAFVHRGSRFRGHLDWTLRQLSDSPDSGMGKRRMSVECVIGNPTLTPAHFRPLLAPSAKTLLPAQSFESPSHLAVEMLALC